MTEPTIPLEFVLSEMRDDIKEIRTIALSLKEDVAGLKVKASLWGGVTSLLVAIGAWLLR